MYRQFEYRLGALEIVPYQRQSGHRGEVVLELPNFDLAHPQLSWHRLRNLIADFTRSVFVYRA